MKRNFNKFKYQPWFRTCRRVAAQLIIPFVAFQFIRTLIIPTFFDIVLLTLFVAIAVSIYFEIF
ncbi:hypothetical protein [Bacillus sp. UNC41MFS5]|uniref:hypothetical protein n=1 Tax=Bacillus sp. UNC41MFS5 TaxID=1449046 RepID=UPI00047B8F03|nr:hypothetical protein [Bacillus sp. UNC41MFS5]